MGRSPVFDFHRAARISPQSIFGWLAAVALTGICLYAFSSRLAALVPPDNNYADALWLGEASQVTRFRLDNQQSLALAGAARALAVDPAGTVWVYGEGLRTYDFSGEPLAAATTEPDNTAKALLADKPRTRGMPGWHWANACIATRPTSRGWQAGICPTRRYRSPSMTPPTGSGWPPDPGSRCAMPLAMCWSSCR